MKFVCFFEDNKHIKIMMQDLFDDERVTVVDSSPRVVNNSLLRIVKRIHLSQNVNTLITLPWRRVWLNGTFPDIKCDEEYIFLFIDRIPMTLDFSYLKKLRKASFGKIKFVLFLLNPVSLFERITQYNLKNLTFDRILTFDIDDSKKYGFTYEMIPYSIVNHKSHSVKYDIYLICWNKGRLPLLHEVYKTMLEHDVSSIYRITDVKDSDQIYDGILYNQNIDYEDVINEFLQCNCILDVLATGQTGVSTRYYEAVCYNKKLLTNNKEIVNLPFYDHRYMHIFEKVEDIDWEWVRERVPVDYHYDGRFSPKQLLLNIEAMMSIGKD